MSQFLLVPVHEWMIVDQFFVERQCLPEGSLGLLHVFRVCGMASSGPQRLYHAQAFLGRPAVQHLPLDTLGQPVALPPGLADRFLRHAASAIAQMIPSLEESDLQSPVFPRLTRPLRRETSELRSTPARES
jgi:hypothetical protein